MSETRTAREWHGLDALAIPPEEWSRYISLYESDGRTPMLTDSIPLIRAFHGETVRNAEMMILAEEFKTAGVTNRLDKPFTEVQLAETLKRVFQE
jgi:hypothetical protein